MKRLIVGCLVCGLTFAASAVEWENIDKEHYLGGRKASPGYLRGKVVLVDRWGAKCPPCRMSLPRMQDIWESYKRKSFVLLGGHCPGWGSAEAVKQLISENGLNYPIYENGKVKFNEPKFDAIPFMYVVDETGVILYQGHGEQTAITAVVQGLADNDSPRFLKQWKRYLDFELAHLPGKAYNRMQEFKKKFPEEAKSYAEQEKSLNALPDIKKLADLVAFAKRAKDPPIFGSKDKVKKEKFLKMVDDAIEKYAPLAQSKIPNIAQEAKNSLADLKWTRAEY